MSLGLLIVIVPALVSIAFIFGGVGAFRHQQRVLATWIRTTGTVVDLHEESTSDGSVYCPIVDFANAQGVTSRFVHDSGSSPAAYKVGESVAVRYDPQTGAAQIDKGGPWRAAAGHFLFGVVFLGAAAVCAWLAFGDTR